MSKATKIWLITAGALVFIGILIFGGAMAMLNWDISKLSTGKFETNEHTVVGEYKNIRINTETANIVFLPSEDGKTSVVCYEAQNAKHSVKIEDGTLTVKLDDQRKWYEHIGINFTSPKITVYLPAGEYGELILRSTTGSTDIAKDFRFKSIDIDKTTGGIHSFASASESIKIKTTTGDILIEGAEAKNIDISVTTGKISLAALRCGDLTFKVSTGKATLNDVTCDNLSSDGTTGNVSMNSVIVEHKLRVERSTGNVHFDACDAGEIFVKTSTGSVTGTLLSEKVFVVNTGTGRKDVPPTRGGGKCEITTSTGDIIIKLDTAVPQD